jgi:hypothetical protein
VGSDFQFTAHLFDVVTQRGKQHIRPLFHARDAVLLNAQLPGHVLLSEPLSLPQVAQGLLFDLQLRCTGLDTLSLLGAQLSQ